jgi:hypothetical protein
VPRSLHDDPLIEEPCIEELMEKPREKDGGRESLWFS